MTSLLHAGGFLTTRDVFRKDSDNSIISNHYKSNRNTCNTNEHMMDISRTRTAGMCKYKQTIQRNIHPRDTASSGFASVHLSSRQRDGECLPKRTFSTLFQCRWSTKGSAFSFWSQHKLPEGYVSASSTRSNRNRHGYQWTERGRCKQ